MAYTDDEFQVIVTGTIGPSEVFSNTFTFLDVAGGGDRQQCVDAVHTLYQGLGDLLSTQWVATQAVIRSLDSGIGDLADWESIDGNGGSHLLPTQLAARVSLDDRNGHNGGPYLCGFTEASNSVNGIIETASRTVLLDVIEQLASDVTAADFQLRIDRPSVESTVAALRARVGTRWDVIRRRSDAIPENYLASSLV